MTKSVISKTHSKLLGNYLFKFFREYLVILLVHFRPSSRYSIIFFLKWSRVTVVSHARRVYNSNSNFINLHRGRVSDILPRSMFPSASFKFVPLDGRSAVKLSHSCLASYELDGIIHLNGHCCLRPSATGSGKLAYTYMLMFILLALGKRSTYHRLNIDSLRSPSLPTETTIRWKQRNQVPI